MTPALVTSDARAGDGADPVTPGLATELTS